MRKKQLDIRWLALLMCLGGAIMLVGAQMIGEMAADPDLVQRIGEKVGMNPFWAFAIVTFCGAVMMAAANTGMDKLAREVEKEWRGGP